MNVAGRVAGDIEWRCQEHCNVAALLHELFSDHYLGVRYFIFCGAHHQITEISETGLILLFYIGIKEIQVPT